MTFRYSPQVFEKAQTSNFIKIRPVGAELFHADRQTNGRTDMTNLTVSFRSFVEVLKNERTERTYSSYFCDMFRPVIDHNHVGVEYIQEGKLSV